MARFILAFFPVVLAVPLGFALFAGAGVPLDHYNVYTALGEAPLPPLDQVTVQDQFGSGVTAVGPATLFLVPADKNMEAIVDPFSHLTCYDTFDPIIPPPQVIATNQLGSQTLNLGPSNRLCLPTEKLITPGPVDLDHFSCYPATGPLLDATVALGDQFQQQSAILLDPFMFCNPADKNGSGIQNPAEHLACYNYNPPGSPIGPVPIVNQFFPASTDLDVLEPWALCLPSQKELPPDHLDHFNMYDAFGDVPPAVVQPVLVADQFGAWQTSLGPATRFLVPASKNGEQISDPFSHLTCYDALDPAPPAPDVIVTHQFGSHQLDVLDPKLLCAPTEKLIAPGPVDLDHYFCRSVIGPQLDIGVSIQDQFQGQSAILLDPQLLCTPADKNGEGIQNPDDHLTCYTYTPPGQPVGPVPIANQFFPASTTLDVLEPRWLCLPSQKQVLPPEGLDHFTVYDASGPDGPLVNIVDQWGAQTTDLGPLDRFLVPASKNGEAISDPISHLACNAIVDGAGGGPPEVWAVNQFGQQQLGIGNAASLCVPTEKLITPGLVDLDHYKCYEAGGPPIDINITFLDQFQMGAPLLLEPFWFCNPAEKNGEAIKNPDDHLACFQTFPPGQPVSFPVPILNQFLPAPTDILVHEQFAFCVPSCKDSDGDGHCDPNDNCPNHFNPGQADTDFVGGGPDGIGDVCDPCVVFDNSIPGGLLDSNGDLIPNVCQCGDANANNNIDSNDLTTIFGCLTAAIPPAVCAANLAGGKAEANNNGLFDSNDLTQIFGALSAAQPNTALTCTNRPEGTPVP